jgi:hypothetical protein
MISCLLLLSTFFSTSPTLLESFSLVSLAQADLELFFDPSSFLEDRFPFLWQQWQFASFGS